MPNVAFLFLVAATVLIYCEFIWVGKIIFGTAGVLLFIIGLNLFIRLPQAGLGLLFMAGAIGFFVLESIFSAYYLAGIIATALLARGFWMLGVAPPLAFPITGLLGCVTVALLSIARRARRNKRLDI